VCSLLHYILCNIIEQCLSSEVGSRLTGEEVPLRLRLMPCSWEPALNLIRSYYRVRQANFLFYMNI
jgi:hypothetical protein